MRVFQKRLWFAALAAVVVSGPFAVVAPRIPFRCGDVRRCPAPVDDPLSSADLPHVSVVDAGSCRV
jgi:hypothetical protein